MKTKIYILFFLILLCLFACNEDTKDYQLLFTGEVTNIDNTGALLSANFINQTSYLITEYGFIWGTNENFSSKIILKKPIKQGTFSFRIRGNLYHNKIYKVKSYVVINDSTYYSNSVSFKSLGSETVELNDFEPKSVFAGDTIIIYGKNFALNNLENIVSLNNNNLITIDSDTNYIKVILPYNIIQSITGKLTVNVSNKTVESTDSLVVNKTWIKLFDNVRLNPNANYSDINGFYSNNKLYLRYSKYLDGLYEFDLNTGQLKKKTDYPSYYPSLMFTIKDKGYLLFTTEGGVKEYNPLTNSWIEKNNFPKNNLDYYSINCVIGDNAYIGLASNTYYSGLYLNVLLKYDSKTDTWSRMADFPGEQRHATCFTYDNKVYTGLGSNLKNRLQFSNEIWEYDPSTNKWNLYETYPGILDYDIISIIHNNKLFIGKKEFWEYNFQTNKWKRIGDFAGNPSGRNHNFSFNANNSLYIASFNYPFDTSFSLYKLNRNE